MVVHPKKTERILHDRVPALFVLSIRDYRSLCDPPLPLPDDVLLPPVGFEVISTERLLIESKNSRFVLKRFILSIKNSNLRQGYGWRGQLFKGIDINW
jgi:hypothetical protein